LTGELSGVPSILGLLFQFALMVALGWLIWVWWRADQSTAAAELSPRQLADAYERDRDTVLPELDTDAKSQSDTDSKNSFAGQAHLPLERSTRRRLGSSACQAAHKSPSSFATKLNIVRCGKYVIGVRISVELSSLLRIAANRRRGREGCNEKAI